MSPPITPATDHVHMLAFWSMPPYLRPGLFAQAEHADQIARGRVRQWQTASRHDSFAAGLCTSPLYFSARDR